MWACLHFATDSHWLGSLTRSVGPGGFEVQWSLTADTKYSDDEAWATVTPLIGPNRTLFLETFQEHALLAFQGPQ